MSKIVENENNNKIFKLDGYLAKQVDWSKYSLVELKLIAVLYSDIFPEWKELNDIEFTVSNLKDKLNTKKNLSVNEVMNMFAGIKEKTHRIAVKPSYNLNQEELKKLLDENNNSGDNKSRYDNENCVVDKEDIDKLFPIDYVLISLIGSVSIKVDQDENYEAEVKKISVGFDEHIKRHLLFAKNSKKIKQIKETDGEKVEIEKLIDINQYFACPLDSILSFKSATALRLYMGLFHLNNIKKKFTIEELYKIMDIKTPKASDYTKLKSLETKINKEKNGDKVKKEDPYIKKYKDFKCRTLKKAIDEINECTNMNLLWKDKIKTTKDGKKEITIVFEIGDYREKINLELESNIKRNADGADEKDNSNDNGTNGTYNDDDDEGNDLHKYNNTTDNSSDDLAEDESETFAIDDMWNDILNNSFGNDDILTEDDETFIKMNINLSKNVGNELEYDFIKEKYLENNKDKVITTKILVDLIKNKK